MLDINGQKLREGGAALLLCEVQSIESDHVLVRVMNSELEIAVGAHHDEVLGGLVADSELTAFVETPPHPQPTAAEVDGVARSAFEWE